MSVSATIVDAATAFTIHHVQSVLVTERDVERGFTDVPVGSRIHLKAARPCAIELTAAGDFFRSIVVSTAGGAIRLETGGAARLQRTCLGNSTPTLDLDYRFELAPTVRPGLYRWPVSAAVLPN